MQTGDTVSSQETQKEQVQTQAEYEASRRAKPVSLEQTQEEEKFEASEVSKNDESKEKVKDENLEAKSEDESEESEEKVVKAAKGAEKRIKSLLKEKTKAQEELEFWKSQALKSQQNPAKQETEAQKSETKVEAKDGAPSPDDFKSYEEYLEAKFEWKLEQREKAKEAKERESKIKEGFESRVKSFQSKIQEYGKTTDGFLDKLNEADFNLSVGVQEALLDSEIAPKIVHEFLEKPEEFERINKLSVIAAAKEIGKIEARLNSESQQEKQTEAKKQTKAPAPLKPVGSKGTAVIKKSLDDPSLSQAEYEALRRAEQKAKYG